MTIRERGEATVRALGNRASLMLRGNGCVVVGRSIQEAVVRAIFLEESARLQYRALVIRQARHGDGGIAVFDDAEIAEIGTDLGRADRIDRKWRSLLVDAGRTPSALPAALPPGDVAPAGGELTAAARIRLVRHDLQQQRPRPAAERRQHVAGDLAGRLRWDERPDVEAHGPEHQYVHDEQDHDGGS